jgi:hypothetical protein
MVTPDLALESLDRFDPLSVYSDDDVSSGKTQGGAGASGHDVRGLFSRREHLMTQVADLGS